MTSTAKGDANSSFCATEIRVSQWEELMRKFSKQHEEQCKAVSLDIPRVYRSTKYFPTGSKYKGTWDILGMSGYGVYTFPNGVIYEGEFEDGMFHGRGTLRYQDGHKLKGRFHKGVMVERKLIFDDGLEYDEQDWQYCKMPDRRFTIEYKEGLQPGGRCNMTARLPPRKIPTGFYDTGDGFYNPATRTVYKPDDLSAILRSPSIREQKWIIENCRSSEDMNVGPRPDLYEDWPVPQLKLLPVQSPAVSTRSHHASIPSSLHNQSDAQDKHFTCRRDSDLSTSCTNKEKFNNAANNEPPASSGSNKSSCKDHRVKILAIFDKRDSNLSNNDIIDATALDNVEFDTDTKMLSFVPSNDEVLSTPRDIRMKKYSNIGITSSILTFTNVKHEQANLKSSKGIKRYNDNVKGN